MNAITFFALFAVTAAAALLVAAAGIAFVLGAAAAIVSKLLRTHGANGVTSRERWIAPVIGHAWAGGSGAKPHSDAGK